MAAATDVRDHLLGLDDTRDLDPLVDRASRARFVLIGEASHGTHEYYAWRSAITRRLIAEHGFAFVAIEGDGPDHRDVDASVKSATARDPGSILTDLRGWPSWLWANTETVEFCEWLRAHNTATGRRVGWYGLDAHPMHAATRTIVDYLTTHEPHYVDTTLGSNDDPLVPAPHIDTVTTLLARVHASDPATSGPGAAHPEPRAAQEPHGRQDATSRGTGPGTATDSNHKPSQQLHRRDTTPRAHHGSGGHQGTRPWAAERLYAVQDAKLAAGAEGYYRAMLAGGSLAWNTRAGHMVAVAEDIAEAHGPHARGVVWAHNTHVGDARATDMAERGWHNLGEHLRLRHGTGEVFTVGFAGGGGEVIAVPRRGDPMRVMSILPPRPTSLEAVLAASGASRALFLLGDADWANTWRDQRAIGVTYDRDNEDGHWIPTLAARRYDALCWFATTTPVHALHLDQARRGELPTLR